MVRADSRTLLPKSKFGNFKSRALYVEAINQKILKRATDELIYITEIESQM